jgi:UDP-N-acetylglucosamine 1-carboxyvinyltransferase
LTDDVLVVHGGAPLQGQIRVRGAKNLVSKAMVAALLGETPSRLYDVPRIRDVEVVRGLLELHGVKVTDGADDGEIVMDPTNVESASTDEINVHAGSSRIPILLCGPLLHRLGRAFIPDLGGCHIGPRPIDFHIQALREFGAVVDKAPEGMHLSAPNGLKGAKLELPYPSVGATEQVLLTAVRAEGVTELRNAAIEPEIIDLIKFLQKMGAIIEQRVDRKIVVEGVQRLHGADHRVITDRNEAVSLAIAAYLTHGDVRVIGADQGMLLTFLNTLYRVGLDFTVEEDAIRFFGSDEPPRPIALETDVHPGFMTDWQQPFTLLLTQARGMSVIHETIYEDRFGYTQDLNRMGADTGLFARCLGELPCRFRENEYLHSCVVRGPTPLHAAELTMPDIRAGAAYILAALCAHGVSTVHGIEHIERGYDHLDVKLRSLGARIQRVPTAR